MKNHVRKPLTVLAVSLIVALVPFVSRRTAAEALAAGRPNIVVILTDDQPVDTLQKMPNVLALAKRGTTFRRAFVSNPLCCPSRASILTGLSSGHTGVWTNGDGSTRWGGWPAFRHNGIARDGSPFHGTGNNETRTVAVHLRTAGYRTGLFGKYLNHYEVANGPPPIPPGWSSWHSFVGDNAAYYGYASNDNGVIHRHGSRPHDYSTDVFGRQALAFLRSPNIQRGTQRFFMLYAPYAPHGYAIPADRDLGVRAPKTFTTRAYNERDVRDKPPYVQRTPLLTARAHQHMRIAWDRTYGTLRSVDRWVGRFRRVLPSAVRRRTIFVFMSDNGQEWGDHRLTYKVYPYERSVRVPLVIAGPGVRHATTSIVVMNSDLTPTFLELAGLRGVGGPYDGRSLVPVLRGTGRLERRGIPLEHLTMHGVPSYCGIRTVDWKYVLYRTGFQELYSLVRDPYELHNLVHRRPHMRNVLRDRALKLCRPRPPDW